MRSAYSLRERLQESPGVALRLVGEETLQQHERQENRGKLERYEPRIKS
jgi:hypothetical protein